MGRRPLVDIATPPMIQQSSGSPLYCDLHRDAQRFYCQTCGKPYCSDCGVRQHVGHVTVHLMDAVEGAGLQANQVMSEAKLGISALREDLDCVQVSLPSQLPLLLSFFHFACALALFSNLQIPDVLKLCPAAARTLARTNANVSSYNKYSGNVS